MRNRLPVDMAAVLLGVMLMAGAARGAEPPPASTPRTEERFEGGDMGDPGPGIDPEQLALSDAFREARDTAFEQFLDADLLSMALDSQDPSLLADAGILLLAAERTLLRPHKAIRAEALLRMAHRQATLRRDQKALERLAKSVEQSGKESLLAEFQAADKLTAGARALDPQSLAAVDGSPEALNMAERFQAFLGQVERSRALSLREDLRELIAVAPDLEFTAKQSSHAVQVAQDALRGLPEQDDAQLALLGRLAGQSRGGLVVESGSVLLATNVSAFAYAKSNLGRKVGDGQCAALAAAALRYAKCKPRQTKDSPNAGDYVWGGRLATITKDNRNANHHAVFAAGALLQLRNVELRGASLGGGTYYRTYSHHTAVVGQWGRDGKGRYMEVYEQNVGAQGKSDAAKMIVQRNRYYLGDLARGTIWVYRPLR